MKTRAGTKSMLVAILFALAGSYFAAAQSEVILGVLEEGPAAH
jgi:hypothetical protein